MLDALMDRTRRNDIHIRARKPRHILLGQAAAHLDQKAAALALAAEAVLQPRRRRLDLLGAEIIQHDDVGAGLDGFGRVGLGLAFDFDFDAEAGGGLGGVHGARDAVGGGPDVVVLEHGHGGEVVPVRVAAADEHAVFFDEAEARGGFSGAGEGVGVGGAAEEVEEVGGSVKGYEVRCVYFCGWEG